MVLYAFFTGDRVFMVGAQGLNSRHRLCSQNFLLFNHCHKGIQQLREPFLRYYVPLRVLFAAASLNQYHCPWKIALPFFEISYP